MSRTRRPSLLIPVATAAASRGARPPSLQNALRALGIGSGARYRPDQLPFLRDDATLGAESEMQAAVAGDAGHVDLALQIRASNYFANVVKHAATEETPQRAVTAIDGTVVPLRADTICVHGDTPGSDRLAVRLRAGFEAAGIAVRAVGVA